MIKHSCPQRLDGSPKAPTVEGRRQALWGPSCNELSPAHTKPYDDDRELLASGPPLDGSDFYEHRLVHNTSEQYKITNLASDTQLAYANKQRYRSQTGVDDLEVVETLLSISKLGAAGWNPYTPQGCHTTTLELPPSPPSSQGGVSPHHPLESDAEETCDASSLKRRSSKDPEFGKV
ncbi:hypothetical protein GWK47_007610 [Chionoecetes opilio]|uniref:Uncharacterized protein n=1 Tax=Chionoecetes opilio TaxID=41210 RepID=A0A8J5CRW0_CHIOP|nr:hypothetical protein GWK47_007610 [Chionoecetes opilio]